MINGKTVDIISGSHKIYIQAKVKNEGKGRAVYKATSNNIYQ